MLEMVDDATLSKEAYLIYQNSFGFEPKQGNLTKWTGIIRDRSGNSIEVSIILPQEFPLNPPIVTVDPSINHPNVDNGKFITRSLARWKPSFHVFQIIKEVKQVIQSTNINYSRQVSPKPQINQGQRLQSQITYLNDQLKAKQLEYETLLKNNNAINASVSQQTLSEINENSILEIQNDLFALEDSYDRLDIDGLEFAKKFLELQKRYYLLETANKN